MQIKNFKIDDSLREMTKHQTLDLPVACYETLITDNIHGYIPPHWHDEFQFNLIIKGKAVFHINEETIEVAEGKGLFINSGCLHMAEDKSKSGCVYICLNVSPYFIVAQELFPTYITPYIQATNLSYLLIDSKQYWGNTIVEAINSIHQQIEEKTPFYEIDVSMQLMVIWKSLLANGIHLEYAKGEDMKNKRMKNMLSWVHQHYCEKVKLEDIARAGQLSRSECCRYFSRIVKKTPMQYVLDYRIQKSLILLQQRESNVTEVAYKVGFSSTSYFIEKFKKAMDMTPLAYKKTIKKT